MTPEVPEGGPLHRLLSDERLVARFRAGDDAAFGTIYRRHRPRVWAICVAVLGSADDAQDAVQETFASASRTLRRRPPDDLRSWLARVARNAAIDLLRARRPTYAAAAEPVSPARADSGLELGELLAALRALPEQQRTALVMRELAGFSYAEIAATLETDETAVNGLIARARLGLRSREEALAVRCESVRSRLAAETDGRRRPAEIRQHLRACSGCREYQGALRADTRTLRAVLPGGGFGLWQLAALLRAPKAAVMSGAVAKAAAGSQAAKLAAVCAVCLGTAGGVGGLALAPPEREPRAEDRGGGGRGATERAASDVPARDGSAAWGLDRPGAGHGRPNARLERMRRRAAWRLRVLERNARSWERTLERRREHAKQFEMPAPPKAWDPESFRQPAPKEWDPESFRQPAQPPESDARRPEPPERPAVDRPPAFEAPAREPSGDGPTAGRSAPQGFETLLPR